ncbi:MAG: AAA family ATPase [Alphaproteobacteria bacterium]|nr:AAA family ATPase [Alphaproteobacteria bacterium]
MAPKLSNTSADQKHVIAFLKLPASYSSGPKSVDVIETHDALVFLAGEEVFKIKRAVKFEYLDFSTLALRQTICEREFALNKPAAPELYLGVVPITQDTDGTLAIDGSGAPVEWAVHMRRFDQAGLYSHLAQRHKIGTKQILALAAEVANYHNDQAAVAIETGTDRVAAIIEELRSAFDTLAETVDAAQASTFLQAADQELDRIGPILDERARAGLIRRCHGDLHLGNIVQLDGRPVLFDALEFDETLATTDLLYEVAFLVMDLWHQGLRTEANLLLNRYLYETATLDQLEGLQALPLFMALRAAIRAMVTAQRATQLTETTSACSPDIGKYLRDAIDFLAPPPPRLVAVGGLSGTGKSTLAAEIAVHIGAVPGAIHIRSDLERKILFGANETDRLSDACYTAEASAKVYDAVTANAAKVLRSGHSVITDAVFADQDQREKIERVAERLGIPFTGLWLAAPESDLVERVEARRGDASDATADTVRTQLTQPTGLMTWDQIDAGGSVLETVISAELALRTHDALRFDEDYAQEKAAS